MSKLFNLDNLMAKRFYVPLYDCLGSTMKVNVVKAQFMSVSVPSDYALCMLIACLFSRFVKRGISFDTLNIINENGSYTVNIKANDDMQLNRMEVCFMN